MVLLIILGVVLLLVGYLAPLPAIGKQLCVLFGAIALAIGLILLIVGVLNGSGASVELDGMRSLL